MTRRIGVLGATGYTGRLVADELDRRVLQHRLGARDPSRLTAAVGTHRELRAVDVGDAGALARFLDGVDVVINTVGPFRRHGPAVVEAAVRTGVAYVDCSGELPFLRSMLDRWARAAVPIVLACGFQSVPGDLGAAVAVGDIGGTPRRVEVHYAARMLPSRGTARTLVHELGGARPTLHRFRFAGAEHVGVEMPLAEQVTLPRRYPAAALAATVRLPLPRTTAWLLGSTFAPLRPALSWVAERLPDGPAPRLRRRDRARVLVQAHGESGSAGVVLDLRDTYGLTARFLVEAALRVERTGASGPGDALDAEPFLDAVVGSDPAGSFSWRRLAPP